MSTSTGTNGATGVAETNGQDAPQDTTGEGVDLHKGVEGGPAINTTAGAAAQEAGPKEQKSELEEILSSGRFLPAEAREIAFADNFWVGYIRYERSSGMYLLGTDGSGEGRADTWVKGSVTAAKQFLEDNGLFDGDIEKEAQRLRDKEGSWATKRFLERHIQGSVEDALKQIRGHYVVDASGSRAGYEAGRILNQNGEVFLVTSSPTLIEPSEGDFPTIKALYNRLFPTDQIYFLAWMRDGIVSLRSGGRLTGKLLVLAGPRDCGKSFLQKYVITPLLGNRSIDPFMYMSGASNFNSLSGYEHWKIEDKGQSDSRSRQALASRMKEMVANEDITEHQKHKDLRSVEAFRRISLSCNDEAKYLNILPDMDDSLMDKVLVLQCGKGGIPEDYGDAQTQKTFLAKVTSELPAFSHYLLNLKIEPKYLGRFGVAIYQNAEIMQRRKTLASSPKGVDLLTVAGEGVEGTAGALFEHFAKRIPKLKALCKNSSKVFGRFYLSPLVKNDPDRAKVRMLNGNKIYTLTGAV